MKQNKKNLPNSEKSIINLLTYICSLTHTSFFSSFFFTPLTPNHLHTQATARTQARETQSTPSEANRSESRPQLSRDGSEERKKDQRRSTCLPQPSSKTNSQASDLPTTPANPSSDHPSRLHPTTPRVGLPLAQQPGPAPPPLSTATTTATVRRRH
jgi:hypothetical protein